MSDATPPQPPARPITPLRIGTRDPKKSDDPDAVLCERCGKEMYRMHAVWRCSGCGFKTDCCGW
jgi:ribosomal protein L37E